MSTLYQQNLWDVSWYTFFKTFWSSNNLLFEFISCISLHFVSEHINHFSILRPNGRHNLCIWRMSVFFPSFHKVSEEFTNYLFRHIKTHSPCLSGLQWFNRSSSLIQEMTHSSWQQHEGYQNESNVNVRQKFRADLSCWRTFRVVMAAKFSSATEKSKIPQPQKM